MYHMIYLQITTLALGLPKVLRSLYQLEVFREYRTRASISRAH